MDQNTILILACMGGIALYVATTAKEEEPSIVDIMTLKMLKDMQEDDKKKDDKSKETLLSKVGGALGAIWDAF